MYEDLTYKLGEPAACPTAYDNVADLPVSVDPGTDPVTHKSELSRRETRYLVMQKKDSTHLPVSSMTGMVFPPSVIFEMYSALWVLATGSPTILARRCK